MPYQKMYLASVTIDSPDAGKQTIVGISHFEGGASAHIADRLEPLGYTPVQIGRILDRVRVTEMRRDSLGCTIKLPGELHHPFGRKA